MSIQHGVLIGFANGDVHRIQVMEAQDASKIAVEEARDIGILTNAGFRTVVASVWWNDATQSASLAYACANAVLVCSSCSARESCCSVTSSSFCCNSSLTASSSAVV